MTTPPPSGGSIGASDLGTAYRVTVDVQTVGDTSKGERGDGRVTIRDRDSMEQIRGADTRPCPAPKDLLEAGAWTAVAGRFEGVPPPPACCRRRQAGGQRDGRTGFGLAGAREARGSSEPEYGAALTPGWSHSARRPLESARR